MLTNYHYISLSTIGLNFVTSKRKVGVQGYFFENFNPYVVRAKDITNSISSSLLISAFYGFVHNWSIMTILNIIL